MIAHFAGWNVISHRRCLNFYFKFWISLRVHQFVFLHSTGVLQWEKKRCQNLKVNTLGQQYLKVQCRLLNGILCGSPSLMTSGTSWYKNKLVGTSLVVQWLRTHLPLQGTRVWALIQEDPTCHRATKPMRHNYLAWALEPASHNYWARVPQLLKPACLEPMLCNKRSHHNEKPMHRNKE